MNVEIRERWKGQFEMSTWETVLRLAGTEDSPDIRARNQLVGEALCDALIEEAREGGITPRREPKWQAAKQLGVECKIVSTWGADYPSQPEPELWCISVFMPIEEYDG